jgi:hypothetical protein
MEVIIRALTGILPNFSALWAGLMGFEVAGSLWQGGVEITNVYSAGNL